MPFDVIPVSTLGEIDREIERIVGRIMSGDATAAERVLVSDLMKRRVEITEPAAFGRLEQILGQLLPA